MIRISQLTIEDPPPGEGHDTGRELLELFRGGWGRGPVAPGVSRPLGRGREI